MRAIFLAFILAAAAPDGVLAQSANAPASRALTPAVEEQVLIAALKGLRLVDSPAKINPAGYSTRGVAFEIADMPAARTLRAQLNRFIGGALKQKDLKRIPDIIVTWYRAHHHPFVAVTFPEQDLSVGVLQIVVTEFRAGKITVAGNRWFSKTIIRNGVRLSSGDRIDAQRLDRDIAWINENPFREVNVVAQKSETPGATDLVLQTADRFPLRIEAGFDNDGVPQLGRARWDAGFTWGNAFWLDQQLIYHFLSTDDFWFRPTHIAVRPDGATLAAHSLSDTIPLPWRDRILVFGAYDQVRPNIGPDFAQTGTDWQAGIRYIVPVALGDGPQQELQFGFDFKRSNNNLEFGGFQISNSVTDVAQFVFSYGTAIPDSWGQTALSNRFVFSPGGLTAGNTDAAYQPSLDHFGVAFAKAHYFYDDVTLNRTTHLPFDFSWLAKAEGEIASTNLLASERLAAGGADSVRGYDPYTATGSLGVLTSQELRSPAFAPLKFLTRGAIADQFQLDGFWDFGWVKDERLISGDPSATVIDSAGIGFRYAFGRYLNIKFDYGWQLRKAPDDAHRGNRLCISATIGS